MTDLSDLIERVRKAEGPDKDLDCYLEALSDGRTIRESIHPQYGRQLLARNSRPPHDEYWIDHPANGTKPYTSSIDAITALIEQKLPGWHIASTTVGEEDMPQACLTEPAGDCADFVAHHLTEALARVEALLLSLQDSSK